MKYADSKITTKNIRPKNTLKNGKCPSLGIESSSLETSVYNFEFYRSTVVMVLSPTYFNPCNVVFNKYCLKLCRHVALHVCSPLSTRENVGSFSRFLGRITLISIRGLGNILYVSLPLEL